jgi:hypothetical protein
MNSNLPSIQELRRLPSPAVAPQALAWHAGFLWIGSRDAGRLYGVDALAWKVVEEAATPGIPWAAVSARQALYVTSGEDAADDRYLRRYEAGRGFDDSYRVPVPELTGSYLSFDGENLYLSQWYKHRLLQLDFAGGIQRTIAIGAEISGHRGRPFVCAARHRRGRRALARGPARSPGRDPGHRGTGPRAVRLPLAGVRRQPLLDEPSGSERNGLVRVAWPRLSWRAVAAAQENRIEQKANGYNSIEGNLRIGS